MLKREKLVLSEYRDKIGNPIVVEMKILFLEISGFKK